MHEAEMRAKREEEERKRLEEALRARQEEEHKRLEEEELARRKQVGPSNHILLRHTHTHADDIDTDPLS